MILTTNNCDGQMEPGTMTDGALKGKRAFIKNIQIVCIADEDDVYHEASMLGFEGPAGLVWAEEDDDGTWSVSREDAETPVRVGLDQTDAVALAYETAWSTGVVS